MQKKKKDILFINTIYNKIHHSMQKRMQTIEGEEVFRYISVIFAIPKVQAPTHTFLRVVKHIFIENIYFNNLL